MKLIISNLILTFYILQLVSCNVEEKTMDDEIPVQKIKVLALFTPLGAKAIIDRKKRHLVDLSLPENIEKIESSLRHNIKMANILIENSAINYQLELVNADGDQSANYFAKILSKTEKEMVDESEYQSVLNYSDCPKKTDKAPFRWKDSETYKDFYLDCRFLEWMIDSHSDSNGIVHEYRANSEADIILLFRFNQNLKVISEPKGQCIADTPGDSSTGNEDCKRGQSCFFQVSLVIALMIKAKQKEDVIKL